MIVILSGGVRAGWNDSAADCGRIDEVDRRWPWPSASGQAGHVQRSAMIFFACAAW
jgi:hypothetical protein